AIASPPPLPTRRSSDLVLADALGEGHLVAGCDGDHLVLHQPAARAIDPIAAEALQFPGKHDGLPEVPSALDPVGARDAYSEGLRSEGHTSELQSRVDLV